MRTRRAGWYRSSSSVAIVMGLLLSACTNSANSAQPVAWHDCNRLTRAAHVDVSVYHGALAVRCLTVRVPVDYRRPHGAALGIRVVELHDRRDRRPIGPLIVNNGGPGLSGISYLVGSAANLRDVVRRFDVVSFDPRGVGLSNPVRCYDAAQEDAILDVELDVSTVRGLAAAQTLVARFAHACVVRYGSRLRFFDTVDTARDIDRIRVAIGAKEITYLGYSYGSELGWVYLRLFPTRIREAVLDAAFDPTLRTPWAVPKSSYVVSRVPSATSPPTATTPRLVR